MFRYNSNNYIKLKKILKKNSIGDYLFKNEIEEFIDQINKDEINEAFKII